MWRVYRTVYTNRFFAHESEQERGDDEVREERNGVVLSDFDHDSDVHASKKILDDEDTKVYLRVMGSILILRIYQKED